MLIYLLLTILDAVTAFVLITHTALGWFSTEVILYHAAYTIIKGAFFVLGDLASKIDIIIGIYIILMAFGIFSNTIVTGIAVIWLLQKALFAAGIWIIKVFF